MSTCRLSLMSVLLLATPALVSAQPQDRKQSFLRSFVQFVRNPAEAMRRCERDHRAQELRTWRAQGLRVIKLGEGCYLTSVKPRTVQIPGGDYQGWLNAQGGDGAFSAYRGGNLVRPRDLENASWKLKAVLKDEGGGHVAYDVPTSISIGYDSSNARRVRDGKRAVDYTADLRFSGQKNARERVSTNLYIGDLDGDLKQEKKRRYFDLLMDLPSKNVHSVFNHAGKQIPFRVTLEAKLLNPDLMIAKMGPISGNQNTDRIALYEREQKR